MKYQNIFKRYEVKFLITKEQCKLIKKAMEDKMMPDKFGKSTICNLYFDTEDYRLIRHSIEKPIYKEKLRLRSYGVADENTRVFAELKKKYQSVVYKRRISMPLHKAEQYLCNGQKAFDDQISKEIDYFMEYYNHPKPMVFISYEREAFYAKDNPDFRMTFDSNIIWRDYDLTLCNGVYGSSILDDNYVLMEVKTANAIPLWLTGLLSENHIYKTSFSKYGSAYKTIMENRGVINYA